MKNEKLAKFFIGEAYNCYSEWGAKVKLLQLEQRYPKLFDDDITQTKVTSVSTHRTSEEQLDFLSLLKAARTISGEIVKRKIV